MKSGATGVEEFETRWPREDDRLFIESEWAFDARVVRDHAERFYRMPMGYKRAGDLLVDQAMVDVLDRSNVIYAALYCYRQCIELLLKRSISQFGGRAVDKKTDNHNLQDLWSKFMDVVKEREISEPLGLSAVQRLVAEMHTADERSDGFRYPLDRKGFPFAFGDRGIELSNLREVMQGLVNFFECADMAWSHQNSAAAE